MTYGILDDPARWAQIADTVDVMIEVAREAKMTTCDLTIELLRSQDNGVRPAELRLVMMAMAYATALQRLAAYEGGAPDE